MKIVFGSDHAGYQLKKHLMDHLRKQGFECEDVGANNGIDAASYVPYASAVADAVTSGRSDYGLVICGTGLGISITANKFKGIRAALCTNEYMARMAREHNDANVLALGARVVGTALAASIADAFLSAQFESGGRHQIRVNEIKTVEGRSFADQPQQSRLSE